MDSKTIEYLTEFLTYLHEGSFGCLLLPIYGDFLSFFTYYYQISTKELYVATLLNQAEEMLNLKKLDVEEVLLSKKIYEEGWNTYDSEQDKKSEIYQYLKKAFRTLSYERETVETTKNWVVTYNSMISAVQSGKDMILSHVDIIAKYFEHYKIKTFNRTDTVYKSLINKIICYIAKKRCCYFLYPDHVKQVRFELYPENEKRITVTNYNIKHDNNSLYITDNKGCDVLVKIKEEKLKINKPENSYYIKDFSDHMYINSRFNEAIDKFNIQLDNSFCFICNPIRLNESCKNSNKKGNLVQMCKNCKLIFKDIQAISSNIEGWEKKYTIKKLRERVKLPNKIEEQWSIQKRKREHLKKLIKIIKEIEKLNNEQKNDVNEMSAQRLPGLLKQQFSEFYKQ